MLKKLTSILVVLALVFGFGVVVTPSTVLANEKKPTRADGVCGGLDPLLCETTH